MKKFTKFLIVTLAFGALVSASFAQAGGPGGRPGGAGGSGRPGGPGAPGGPGGPGGQGQRRNLMHEMEQKILNQLNLTADQKAKIKKLDEDTDKKMKALMDKARAGGANVDRQKVGQDMRKIMEDRKTALYKILTPAQKTKYDSLMKAEMEKFRKEHPRGAGGPGGAGAPGAGGKPGGGKPGGNGGRGGGGN